MAEPRRAVVKTAKPPTTVVRVGKPEPRRAEPSKKVSTAVVARPSGRGPRRAVLGGAAASVKEYAAKLGERLGTGSTTTLFTPWWLTEFDSQVGGVSPILQNGTAVANASVAAVQAAFTTIYPGSSLPLVQQSSGPIPSPNMTSSQVLAYIAAQATADAAAYPPMATVYQSLSGALDHAASTPTFTRHTGSPQFTAAASSLGSIYWWSPMRVGGLISSPLDAYYAWYSKDHDTANTSAPGGIALCTAPSPLGPWTDRGQVFVDTTASSYDTEGCSVLWDEVNSLFRMYYKQILTTGAHIAKMATSPDGVTWTVIGQIMQLTWTNFPGQGSVLQGYFSPYRVGPQWTGFMANGGGNYPHYNVAWSLDGINWTPDPRVINNQAQASAGQGITTRTAFEGTVPFLYRGRIWVTAMQTNFVSGSSAKVASIVAAPLSENGRQLVGTPVTALALPLWISALTPGSTTAITTLSAHGLTTGQTVTVAGLTGSGIVNANGTWTVTVTSSTAFTITANTTGGTYANNGYVVLPGQLTNESPNFRSQRIFVDPGTNQIYLYYITANSTALPATDGVLNVAVCNG